MNNPENEAIKSVNYRNLNNNLLYISNFLIEQINQKKCSMYLTDIFISNDDQNLAFLFAGIDVSVDTKFVSMQVTNLSYEILIFENSDSPSQSDKDVWDAHRWFYSDIQKTDCPGVLRWKRSEKYEHEDDINKGIKDVNLLVYQNIKKIQDAYLSSGGISPDLQMFFENDSD